MQETDKEMRFICKYCGLGIDGTVIVYEDNGQMCWIQCKKNVRKMRKKLEGRKFTVKDGIPS